MKRRTFIKALGAALLAPFVPSTVKKAIPDPVVLSYASFPIPPQNGLAIGNLYTGRRVKFDAINYGWYAVDQWTKRQRAQMALNKQRSLVINRIKTNGYY